MQLSHEEVRKIAKLARLALSDAEVEKFSRQLSDILTYSRKLDEVDTDGVEPIAQITGLQNVLFADQVQPCENAAELLKCSPQPIRNHMIQVKNVFE